MELSKTVTPHSESNLGCPPPPDVEGHTQTWQPLKSNRITLSSTQRDEVGQREGGGGGEHSRGREG